MERLKNVAREEMCCCCMCRNIEGMITNKMLEFSKE